MRFLVFAEGTTEELGVGAFLGRWLNLKLSASVGVRVVKLRGSDRFEKDIAQMVALHLGRDRGREIIAAIGLLDLYAGISYPKGISTADERYEWGAQHFGALVDHDRFRMFFAVHEAEAWLFSDPSIFPREIGRRIPGQCAAAPEQADFDSPPARRLAAIYRQAARREYRKVTDGVRLFRRLDPQVAYGKCPYLRRLLDEMLRLARQAGL